MSKLIRVSDELKRFLDTQAIKKGETYEQIIRRLLETIWKVKVSQTELKEVSPSLPQSLK